MACTKEEVAALKRNIPGLFENLKPDEWPLPKGKVMDIYIEFLGRKKEYVEIYSFFKYLSETDPNGCRWEEWRCFYNYPRIYLWRISVELDCFIRENGLSELEEDIIKFTEHIILGEEKSLLLVKEIDEFIKSSRFNYEDRFEAYNVIKYFNPIIYLYAKKKGNDKNKIDPYYTYKFYPYDLYEKIKEVIPPIAKKDFKYEYDPKYFNSDEDSEKSDTESKKSESKLPENILSQEMSDDEIIENLKKYSGALLDKAAEEKNDCIYKFITRKIDIPLWSGETKEEFINYVLKTEIKKCGKVTRFLDFEKETIGDDTIIWNSVHNQKSRFYDEDFSIKVSEVFLHRDDLIEPILQISLNEIVYSTEKCLEDISKKIHLLILIGTKKSFLKIWEVLGIRKFNYDVRLYVKVINEWSEYFPIKLLRKEIENKNNVCIFGVLFSKNEYVFRAFFSLLYKNYNDIIDQIYYGEIIIELLGQVEYRNLEYIDHYKLLICLSTIELYNKYLGFCGEKIERYRYKERYLLDIVGIIKNNSAFGQKIEKTFEKLNIDLTNKLALWEKHYKPYITEARRCLYEGKKLDLHNFTPKASIYNEIRNIMFEKPFLFPEYSPEMEKTMADYFFRELPSFQDFCDALPPRQRFRDISTLWRLYLLDGIEKSYKNFKHEELEKSEFGKPLLPIIPEYAEYLLSRADDIFSTAIENIPYNEYKTFLTESRKQQIKICLKNNTIKKEEFDRLTALAENIDKNYYAWSNKEIKNCLSPDTKLEKLKKLNAILEPEFMVRIFEKTILWVMGHRDSELWPNAPLFGMQIFNESYKDRPSIWAKHLIKIVDEWNGSENMLKRTCIALGHLREPLGSKVPIKLREMAKNLQDEDIKNDILTQLSLFNHEHFKKMHHDGNEEKRVKFCKDELIRGQNTEVRMQK